MSEWNSIPLEDLADNITVGFVGSMTQEYIESGIPFLRSKNVEPYRIDLDDLCYISSEFHQKIKKSALSPGDVVIVRTGKPGAAAIIPESFPVANCSDLVIVRPSPKLDRHFLVYYLNSIAVRHINSRLVGAVQQHFNIGAARELKICCPPVEEQQEIASVLTCLDRKISNLRQQNETLEAIAQTLFKHWFVDFEFPNEDGKPYRSSGGEMVRSELGEIPASWHIEPLKKCLTYLIDNRGKTPTFFDIGIPALSAKFVKGGDLVNRDSFNYVSYELFEQSEKLEVGDIILTSEAPLGETYFIAKETRYYPAQRVFALRANPEVISCSYLNYWFSSTIGQSLLQRRASGSTVQGIKQSELYQCEVIFPAKRIQNLASDAFMKALLKREANSKQIQILTKIRDALLPNLMNGKVRIKS